MKLNLGCGRDKHDGYVNVDIQPLFEPDLLYDLEQIPWPWPTSSVDKVFMSHILEHLGYDPKVYLAILAELYRVCKHGALVVIRVPHWRHEMLLNDPTHVRPITPEGLKLFDKSINENARMGIPIDVDFKLVQIKPFLDGYWEDKFKAGEISEADLEHAVRSYNNVIAEVDMVLLVSKVP